MKISNDRDKTLFFIQIIKEKFVIGYFTRKTWIGTKKATLNTWLFSLNTNKNGMERNTYKSYYFHQLCVLGLVFAIRQKNKIKKIKTITISI